MKRAAPWLLLLAVAAVYAWRVGSAPIYLTADEPIIANDAFAIATTGRTVDGVAWPLFVYVPTGASWFMPAIYYWSVPFLKVLPFGEAAIRLPTVTLAVISIALCVALSRRLFGDRRIALVPAIVLAGAPALFMLSRYGLDYIYPIPFILGWLWCLTIGLEPGRPRRWLMMAGLCLGAGTYSYIASTVLMPAYLGLTLLALLLARRRPLDIAAVAGGFAVPLSALLIWLVRNPSAFQGTANRYALQSVDLVAVAGRYVRFFDPGFLFLTGDSYLPFSTRTAGVFALAAALLIAAGIYAVLKQRPLIGLIALVGFCVAPLPAALLDDPEAIRRATGMLAFGAVLAGFGARHLASMTRITGLRGAAWMLGAAAAAIALSYVLWIAVSQQRLTPTGLQLTGAGVVMLAVAIGAGRVPHGPLLAATSVAAIVAQFMMLQFEYHGSYRARSAPWLNGNLRGALTAMIVEADRDPGAPIVFAQLRSGRGDLDARNRWLPAYWRFYLAKHDRLALLARTSVVSPLETDLSSIAPGSIVLGSLEDPYLKPVLAGPRRAIEIPEVGAAPSLVVLRR